MKANWNPSGTKYTSLKLSTAITPHPAKLTCFNQELTPLEERENPDLPYLDELERGSRDKDSNLVAEAQDREGLAYA